MKKIFAGITLLLQLLFMNAYSQDEATEKKIEELLEKMTLEEKIGQMNQYTGFWEVTGPVPEEGNAKKKYDDLKSGKVGSVLNVRGVENVRTLQKLVVEESRLGIPLLFGYDVIHGHKTLAPIPLAEAASWDLAAIERSAQVAATEAAALGINWTFAPMVDISRDARWGRVMEGAGEDPYLGSKIAIARIRGFQGDDLSAVNTIAACAKHFAAYGFAEAGRDYNTVDIGTSTLYNVVLPPFKAAIDANVATFMNAFNTLNGIPATGDAFLQRNILKGKWDFQGFVVSDWGSIAEMIPHGFAQDLPHAAHLAANAGSDMDMESYAYINHLQKLVEEGKVPEKHIDDAVRRILRIKFQLGLFDDPYRYCDEQREDTLIYHEDHMEAVLDIAKKSIVLLKNEDNILPISSTQRNIAVIGALANDKNSPLGSWRIGSDDSTAVSVLEGLQKFSKELKFVAGPALYSGATGFITEVNINEEDTTGFAEAVRAAEEADLVILVMGEHGFQSGEGRSRAELGLPGLQQQLLDAIAEKNENTILVLMNGRPLVLTDVAPKVKAIVEAWQLGTQTGNAVAEVLYGKYNPSGKLPMSFPRAVGQLPLYYNYLRTGRPGPKAEVFWSHYIDEENAPLYPFGFGLSYTTFAYENLKVDSSNPDDIKVSVTVKNTGERDGEEVVQLYLHDQAANIARPVKELKGFEKLMLKAGEAKTVTFSLTEKELGFFMPDGTYVVEPGAFSVMVGTNAQEGLSTEFTIEP